jgi:hypothetical protein
MTHDNMYDEICIDDNIVCGWWDWWWYLLCVEIIMIDDNIYCMWKLLWLMIIFIVCGNYYDWW